MPSASDSTQKPRKKPTQGRSQATVSAILQATAHILATDGYEALSTNRVAEKAGVSIGSLYQYFPSKESLVGELVDRECDRLNALFGEVFMRARDLPPRELARELIGAIYRAKSENPQLSKALREQIPRTGRIGRLEEALAQITTIVGDYLEANRKELRVKSPRDAAFYAVELVDGLTMSAIIKWPRAHAERVIQEIADIVTAYLFGH